MYSLTCDIEIRTAAGPLRLRHASAVQISKSADRLCDTLSLALPRRVRWRNIDKNPIRRGDPIRVSLGYDGRDRLAFAGVVARVVPGAPMVVEAQDPMSLLQAREAVRKSYASVTLDRLLADQGLEAAVLGRQSLGAYRVESATVAELLDALRRQGVRSMMRIGAGAEPRLYAGLVIAPPDRRVFTADDRRNVADRSGLRYEADGTAPVLVRVKSHSAAGRRAPAVVEAGRGGGSVHTFNVVGLTDAEARQYALARLESLKAGGLSGVVTLFGGQVVDKLDAISLTLDGRHCGTWQADRVDISWGPGGFRQALTLGPRVTT